MGQWTAYDPTSASVSTFEEAPYPRADKSRNMLSYWVDETKMIGPNSLSDFLFDTVRCVPASSLEESVFPGGFSFPHSVLAGVLRCRELRVAAVGRLYVWFLFF